MIRWFRRRRRRPAPPAPIEYSYSDIMIACAWGLTLAEWDHEGDSAREWLRRNVTQAPNFRANR